MAFTEDLSVFFNEDEFAVSATLDGASVTGIFDNGYTLGAVGPTGMASAAPMFRLPTASVPASPHGKSLVTGGITYRVVGHEPDGTGVSILLLEKTS